MLHSLYYLLGDECSACRDGDFETGEGRKRRRKKKTMGKK
jgi:hypothetical protein